jgi:VanZ family protein
LVQSIPAGDKVGHFLLFGTLAFLANLAVARSGASLRWHLKISALVVVVVVAEELSQIFLPHRNFDSMDLVADLAGIILFSAFAYFWKRSRLAA